MPAPTVLNVAPTDNGCVIRVEGSGTMKQSPAVRGVLMETLNRADHSTVVIDLSGCEYLDSTFLGFLAEMFGRFDKHEPKRFFVAGTADRRKTLLHAVRLDGLIPQLDEAPPPRGPWVPISISPLEPRDLSRHVMECHRILAQADSPMSAAFAKIADQIERELGTAN
jgi:anti-anti-sigma factor